MRPGVPPPAWPRRASPAPSRPADHHRETILIPLNMTEQQKEDLKAFLETLTAPLPDEALLTDPRQVNLEHAQ